MILLPLAKRVLGGAAFGLTLYLRFRRLLAGTTRQVIWSAWCALFCLADAGFLQGATVKRSLDLAVSLWRGTTPMTKPDALAQYRIVTPLLNLPLLLLLAVCVVESGPCRPTPCTI